MVTGNDLLEVVHQHVRSAFLHPPDFGPRGFLLARVIFYSLENGS